MTPTIWTANDAGHPFHKANAISGLEDAPIKPLTVGNIKLLDTDRLIKHLIRGIGEYVKSDDWLIVSGSGILVGHIQMLWMYYHERINILYWHAARREYVPRTIELDNIDRQFEMLEWRRD